MNLHRRDENSVYAQAAFDSPANQKSRSNKKRLAIIDTWQQPIWPKLAKILFISMIVLSSAMALVEIKNAMISSAFDPQRFLFNLSTTLIWIWGIHAVLLAVCSAIGAFFNQRSYEKRKAESGIHDTTDEERARSKRAVRRLNASYILYMRVAFVGLAVFTVLYLTPRLL